MPKRRANGEGNIRKRKDGRWEGRYTAGYDANGKGIAKNVLGKTQAEVKDKLRAAIEDSKKLDPVKAGSYTLEQWLRLWYSVYIEPQVRYSTKEFYHNAIDHHIIPKLGSVKLEKLTMLQIQQFYNELLKSGRVQKKNQPELKEHGLSPRMVQCVHVVLNKALEYAVEEKLILANPAKKCKIPKNTHKEMNILPEALIGPYLSAAKEHGILAPMYLELTTGLRRGELLALRWEDLDVQNRTVVRGDEAIPLTKREFDLLNTLLSNMNQVMTREELLLQVWKYDDAIETNVVDVYIRYLRGKIDVPGKESYIQTVRGMGYVIREK